MHVVFPGEMHALHMMEREREGDWSLRRHLHVGAFYYFLKCDHVNGKEARKTIHFLLHRLRLQNKIAGIDGIDTEFF